MNFFSGMEVITDVNLTEAGEPVTVRRTWRERLLTRPWRPFQRTKRITPQVPYKGAYQVDGKLLMHPATLEMLRAQLEARR